MVRNPSLEDLSLPVSLWYLSYWNRSPAPPPGRLCACFVILPTASYAKLSTCAGVAAPLKPGAKLYVSHARVLGASALGDDSLRITHRIADEQELRAIPDGLSGAFGSTRAFPILELTRG